MTNRSLPPSSKRRRQLEKDGKIVNSRLVPIVSQIVVAIGLLCTILNGSTVRSWVPRGSLVDWFRFPVNTNCGERCTFDPLDAFNELSSGVINSLSFATGFLGICSCVALFVHCIQTRCYWQPANVFKVTKTLEGIVPSMMFARCLDRLRENWVGVWRVLVFCLAVASCLVQGVRMVFRPVVAENVFTDRAYFEVFNSFCVSLSIRVSVILIILGLVDFAHKRWRWLRAHSMSAMELRDEVRDDEGDPFLRRQQREVHESLVLADLEARVRRAKVIVVQRWPALSIS